MATKPLKPISSGVFALILVGVILLFSFGMAGMLTALHMIHTPAEKSDYQITCEQDTITIMDGPRVIQKIPYSDSSDLWRIVEKDNQ